MNTKERIQYLLRKYEEPIFTSILFSSERQLYLDDYYDSFRVAT